MSLALATVGVGLGVASAAAAGRPGAAVAGNYTYFEGRRTVTLRASLATGGAMGTWAWQNNVNSNELGGPITCLVIDGADAWLAGPTSDGELAQFTYVHDGGSPGVGHDQAVTWIIDPGQTLEDMEAWCESQTILDVLFDVEAGNLTVR
jgi:hypothetical protein